MTIESSETEEKGQFSSTLTVKDMDDPQEPLVSNTKDESGTITIGLIVSERFRICVYFQAKPDH